MNTDDVMGSRAIADDLLDLAEATRALFSVGGGEINGDWLIAALERAGSPVPPVVRNQVQAVVSALSRLERTAMAPDAKDAGSQG